jgi:hypothetical protein
VNACVEPDAIETDDGVTVTRSIDETDTVTVAVPDTPSIRAVITAVPTATAVTSPSVETVATPTLELDHVAVKPLTASPAEFSGVAASCAVFATAIDADPGDTMTDTIPLVGLTPDDASVEQPDHTNTVSATNTEWIAFLELPITIAAVRSLVIRVPACPELPQLSASRATGGGGQI